MDWNSSNPRSFSRPQSSLSFICNFNNEHYVYPPGGQEMRDQKMQVSLPMEMNQNEYDSNNQEKKKKLTCEQLESLENSFQEEIKLDPDRKMKLAHELGLQPRQIAVWFQNRRARWKAKQLERLYDALKQEYDVVSREKQKLQQEVLALRSILKEQASKIQGTTSSTHISGEETCESTSVAALGSSGNHLRHLKIGQFPATAAMVSGDCNYMFNYDASAVPTPSYSNWALLPSNYP